MYIRQKFKYFLVLDFEANCLEGVKIEPQEIIEFPCLMVSADNFQIVDQFHQYIKVICEGKVFERTFLYFF